VGLWAPRSASLRGWPEANATQLASRLAAGPGSAL